MIQKTKLYASSQIYPWFNLFGYVILSLEMVMYVNEHLASTLILNQLKETNVLIDLTALANYFYFAWSKGCQNKFPLFTYYLLTDSEVITGKSQTEDGRSVNTSRTRSERFPCKDRTDEVNKLSIRWPFHYGPEPAINENRKHVTLEGASSQPTYATRLLLGVIGA